MVMAALAAACLGAPLDAHAQSQAQKPTPADPRALIRRDVTLVAPATLDGAEVSELRGTGGPQPGDTMACLRTGGERAAYIAVFFEAGRVIDYRRAVALDRCAGAAYAQLPQAAQVKAARAGKKAVTRHDDAMPGAADSAEASPAGRD
jgi:hypothetical protein